MIFPTSFSAGLAILVVSLLCWGSWANTLKSRKWRYELYYIDFSFGFLIFAVIAAFTLGSLRSTDLTFQDNFLITGYRKMAYAIAAGAVFNIGNLLLSAAISAGGMSIAFPISFGMAMVVGVIWDFAANPEANAILMFGGALLALGAALLLAFSYSTHRDALAEAAKMAALQVDPRTKKGKRSKKTSGAATGIALSVVGGVILAFFPPVARLATVGENGVSAYGTTLLIGIGIVFSSLAAAPFTINFPLTGVPARLIDYLRASVGNHLLGLTGGALVCCALLGGMVVVGSPVAGDVGPVWPLALRFGAPLIAMIWGLFAWKEFAGASGRVKNLLVATAVLYSIGVALVSIAPLYAAN